MKLVCPQCGLKGTAEESLFEQNVKCPACEAVFLLAGTVLAGEEKEQHDISLPGNGNDVTAGGETRRCASCGFVLSENYLAEVGDKLYCQVCIAAEEQKAA